MAPIRNENHQMVYGFSSNTGVSVNLCVTITNDIALERELVQ